MVFSFLLSDGWYKWIKMTIRFSWPATYFDICIAVNASWSTLRGRFICGLEKYKYFISVLYDQLIDYIREFNL